MSNIIKGSLLVLAGLIFFIFIVVNIIQRNKKEAKTDNPDDLWWTNHKIGRKGRDLRAYLVAIFTIIFGLVIIFKELFGLELW
jgi:hypothetical protein